MATGTWYPRQSLGQKAVFPPWPPDVHVPESVKRQFDAQREMFHKQYEKDALVDSLERRLAEVNGEIRRLQDRIATFPEVIPFNPPPSYSYLGEWLPRRISIPESWRQPLLELAGAVLVVAVPLIMAFLGR